MPTFLINEKVDGLYLYLIRYPSDVVIFSISSLPGRDMFLLAIFIAVYSYLIFLAGVFGFLYRPVIYLISGIYLIFIVIYYRRGLDIFLKRLEIDNFVKSLKHQKISVVLFSLVILQGLVNLIGVFGPELSFDALWYHLDFT